MAIAGLPESIREKCRQQKISTKSTLVEISRQFDEQEMHNFLDSLKQGISTKISKPKTKKSANNHNIFSDENVSNQTAQTEDDTNSSRFVSSESFNYTGIKNDFILTIKFDKNKDIQKKDVLKALKEVFDNVKKDLS